MVMNEGVMSSITCVFSDIIACYPMSCHPFPGSEQTKYMTHLFYFRHMKLHFILESIEPVMIIILSLILFLHILVALEMEFSICLVTPVHKYKSLSTDILPHFSYDTQKYVKFSPAAIPPSYVSVGIG